MMMSIMEVSVPIASGQMMIKTNLKTRNDRNKFIDRCVAGTV